MDKGNPGEAFDPKKLLVSTRRGRMVRLYDKGDVVFKQADAADAVLYIRKGNIKIAVASRQGKAAELGILKAVNLLGEGCLIGQPGRLSTATALTKCAVTRAYKAEMINLLKAEPGFRELFTKHLLTRNERLEEDLADQLFNSRERRLARTLLLLASTDREKSILPIVTSRSLKGPVAVPFPGPSYTPTASYFLSVSFRPPMAF